MLKLRTVVIGVAVIVLAGLFVWFLTRDGDDSSSGGVNIASLMAVPDTVLHDVIIGDPNAPVTIIEYASLTCPHCGNFHRNVYPQLLANYVDTGRVRIILREFSRDDIDLAAFMVARCVPDEFRHDVITLLFEQQHQYTTQNATVNFNALQNLAMQAGFTQAQFETCLSDNDLQARVTATTQHANRAFGVTGTPTFFVNGELVQGAVPMTTLGPIIDRHL